MVTLTEIKQEGLYYTFIFSDGKRISGGLTINSSFKYYISLIDCYNNYIFTKLGITNPNEFVLEIVGYAAEGGWPEVKTKEDLDKVLNALLKYNKVETKEVKIQIPDGYEIDQEASTFECIKFKRKQLTYEEIQKELFDGKIGFVIGASGVSGIPLSCLDACDLDNIASAEHAEKIEAIIKLMNVAYYLNGKRHLSDGYRFSMFSHTLRLEHAKCGILFKDETDAQRAVEILGEETIKKAII